MYCEHWEPREIAEAVFACITHQEYQNGNWVESDDWEEENGRDVYFDSDSGDCYRSCRQRNTGDMVVFNDDLEGTWIEYCEANELLVDEEWQDCESAIDWIEEEICASFGEGNDFFIKDKNEDDEEDY